MTAKVSLKAIVDELDFMSEEYSSFLNTQTGEVVHVAHEDMNQVEEEGDEEACESDDEEPEWNSEGLEIARAVADAEEGVYVGLPSKFDIHEYEIMADFCRSVKDLQISDALCGAIHGSGAFRRFKDGIHRYGITDQWYAFREKALKEIVKQWCEVGKIDYIDDEPADEESGSEENGGEGLSEKQIFYQNLTGQIHAVVRGERDFLANAANIAAMLYQDLPEINWAGFYFLKGRDLVLGPFQGKPACTRIGPGKGVCGAAAAKKETVVIEDVKKFPGHIACDEASKSEIVVSIIRGERLVGVLDLDSPVLARFDDEDRVGLEGIVRMLLEASDDER